MLSPRLRLTENYLLKTPPNFRNISLEFSLRGEIKSNIWYVSMFYKQTFKLFAKKGNLEM